MNFENNFDFALERKSSSKFDPQKYWTEIDNFLNKISTHYGNKYKIVIAAHPKRDLGNYPINKKFIHHKTAELIQESKFVITHYSNSTILAVLFKKPILLVDVNEFDLHAFVRRAHINFLSEKLSIKKINLRDNVDLKSNFFKKYLIVNKKKYNNFFNNYYGFEKNKSYGEKWKIILKLLTKTEIHA